MPTIGPAFEPLPDDPGERAEVAAAARRTPGPARPRRHPRLQPLVRARRAARPARADPDRRWRGGWTCERERGRGRSGERRCCRRLRSPSRWPWSAPTSPPAAPRTSRRKTQDPCKPRPWRNPAGLQQIAQQFTLSALDGAACQLGVSRETLARALATQEAPRTLRRALRDRRRGAGEGDPRRPRARGRRRRRSRRPQPVLAGPLRETVRSIPLDQAIELINDAASLLDNVETFLGPAQSIIEACWKNSCPSWRAVSIL